MYLSDVDVEKPDEKSIMTYVALFLKAYPEAGEDPSVSLDLSTFTNLFLLSKLKYYDEVV